MNLLDVNGLSHGYHQQRILDNISLQLKSGETVALLGAQRLW